jgi:hypothetical protein
MMPCLSSQLVKEPGFDVPHTYSCVSVPALTDILPASTNSGYCPNSGGIQGFDR